MTRIILCGCSGAMGRMITGLCEEDNDVRIVAGVDVKPDRDSKYPIFESISDCDIEADAVIDFSRPEALHDILNYCEERQLGAVLCTTGYDDEQIKDIEDASKKFAILRSANMSLGINVLIKLLKEAANVFSSEGFDIEIVEKHHNRKVDAPSGTALALADAVNDACDTDFEYVYDRSGRREKRSSSEIGISAVRGGTIVGDHDVIFAGTDEVITFSHRAYSRAVFGKGAIAAARFIVGREAGMYDMSDVIGNR
ncbi:MAG: 4-hydroxy-tetrahydrodipicolinate reductase [Eubacterium sp.]|nr:4-hydroxy-tetrahydrodipicolinate reductase [Eubacterium sp.]